MAKPKTEKSAKKTQEEVNADEKALFLHHLPIVEEAKAKLEKAKDALKRVYNEAKIDGFAKADFLYALDVQSPEKEADTKARIYRQLQIAKFLGSDLGTQMELFAEPEPAIPVSDRAYDEGRNQALQNKPAKPGYDPGTDGYRQFLKGYHSVNADKVGSGFIPMTEDEFRNQQEEADRALKQ